MTSVTNEAASSLVTALRTGRRLHITMSSVLAQPLARMPARPSSAESHGPCRLCGSPAGAAVLATAGRRLWRCSGCSLIRLDPAPTAAELSAVYDSGRYYTTEPPQPRQGLGARLQAAVGRTFWAYPGSRSLAERALGWLVLAPLRSRFLPVPFPGNRPVLDIGCGNGQRLLELQQAGCTALVGLEPTLGAAEQARRATRAEIHTTLLDETPLPAAHFGVVVMNQVLEHVPDPVATLRRLRGLLADDGMLYLTVPNIESAEAAVFGVHWSGLQLPEHLHHFSPGSLRACLAEAGWRVTWESTDTVAVVTAASLHAWAQQPALGWRRHLARLPAPLWWPLTWLADRLGRGQMLRVVAVRGDTAAGLGSKAPSTHPQA